MKGCNLEKYIMYNKKNPQGKIGYNLLKMLKVILFSFMKEGYASLRTLEDKCKNDLRYVFNEINKVIIEKEHVKIVVIVLSVLNVRK